jgi:hypothetical protein
LIPDITSDIANYEDIDPHSRREGLSMRILGRIGVPATEYLRELSKGPEKELRTRRARAALELVAQP